ncbi:hypothetical protein MGR01S_18720 [Meiothermus granaticius NBRC 107808]|uniref:PEGA domain protein n=1 Tax=Meiothermus granaticius NBRC 107808 TaxID=1227551 RepID=A0A399FBS4_9DEIN|nr:hypothetical protein Mgrana_00434 [Meiothermus granaticius NBRC 107808]GEM87247.1 hypothetical protein MGR01S_18720 [Meiothermus granaticius NBRC 107808]
MEVDTVKRNFYLLALGGFGLGGLVSAAPQLSPQSIIVNPVPTDLQVRTWVDKDPGKTGNPVYQIGERIRVSVQVNQDAYVYLFSVHSNGDIAPILPNAFERDNFLRAGQTRTFPPQGANYEFKVEGPEGQDRVLAIASRRPLDMSNIIDVANSAVRVQGADNLSRALSIVVTPIPQQDWVSNVAFFVVGRLQTPPPPSTGFVGVSSFPQGAQVLLNGRSVGNAPINLTLNPGTYTLELRLAGYDPYRTTVQVRSGESININATLNRTPMTGRLEVLTNVEARIFVNGSEVGSTTGNFFRLDNTNPGRVQVVAIAPGYRVAVAEVTINPGQTSPVQLNLSRIP